MGLYLIDRKPKLTPLKLAEQAGYIVRVSKISENRILTLFPDRLFGHPQYKSVELIHEISKENNAFKVRRYDKKWRSFVGLSNYMVRPFIIQDIYLKCGFLGIDQELVVGYDENNKKVKQLIEAIPEPEGVDKAKELNCASFYIKKNLGIDITKLVGYKEVEPGIKFIEKFVRDSAEKFLNEEILE